MSNYNSLKNAIDANIKQNGNQEITGQVLNSVLNQMVTTLGAGYQFAGVATIDTNPGTPDAKVFYIANGKGTYTNFGSLNVTEDDVVVLYWDTAWHKEATGIASQAKLEGEAIYDALLAISSMNDMPSNKGWLSANTYDYGTGYHKVFPVIKGSIITIKSTYWQNVVFYKLKSYIVPRGNDTPDFCNGAEQRFVINPNSQTTFTAPDDMRFLVVGDVYNTTSQLPEDIIINGWSLKTDMRTYISSVLQNQNRDWINGYYLDSNQLPVAWDGWQYMLLDVSIYNKININSVINGDSAYGFLVDDRNHILKQWNNQVIDETLDLINDYPTAKTLKICGRVGEDNYIETSKFPERIPQAKNIKYPLLAFDGKYVHFSVDDSLGIWKQLVSNPNVSSIFDLTYFGALKDIHDATGMCVTLNLFCCDASVGGTPTVTLADIPDRWANEFKANSDWLKFALHSYFTDQQYGTPISGHSLSQDFAYCNNQIKRFTGTEKCISRQIRLGYFNCPSEEEAVSIANVANGVKIYSTADDTRASNMYLKSEQISEINSKGLLYDEKNELIFIKSMPRLDNTTNISSLASTAMGYKSTQKVLELFCHEPSYYTYKEQMISLFNSLKNEYGFNFKFLSDLFNN